MSHTGNHRWDCDKSGCLKAVMPDWSIFNDCFGPTKIRVSDIDGVVERNGRVLFFEWKQKRQIDPGQTILFKRLSEKDHVMVVVLVGHTRTTITGMKVFNKGNESDWSALDTLGAQKKVDRWFNRSNASRL